MTLYLIPRDAVMYNIVKIVKRFLSKRGLFVDDVRDTVASSGSVDKMHCH